MEQTWTATHRIVKDGGTVDVMLIDGAAYTQTEAEATENADFECNEAGEWTFQGAPFAGYVEALPVTDTENRHTPDGEYVIYHKSTAGNPDCFTDNGGPWYFEPVNYDGGDVFSSGYMTPEAAIDAAMAWADQEAAEEAKWADERANAEV